MLTGKRAGDNRQLEDVAQATGLPVRRLAVDVAAAPAWKLSLFPASHINPDPTPDLKSADDRTAVLVAETALCAISAQAKRNGAKFKLVCIGKPRGHQADFDLIITAPHFRFCQRHNVHVLPFPPHAAVALESAGALRNTIAPGSTVCLLGGSAAPEEFNIKAALELIEKLKEMQAADNATLAVLGSPRTPPHVMDIFQTSLNSPQCSFFPWRKSQTGLYAAALAQAGKFIVTSDSVSMMVEAMLTRKPVFIYELPRRSGLWRTAVNALCSRGWLKQLFDSGLIEPRADRRLLISQLAANGWVTRLGGPSSPTPSRPPTATVGDAARLILDL